MEITTDIQLGEALFWTLTALVGMAITLPVLVTAYRGWRLLLHEELDQGMATMALSHVQGDALRLFMHLCFFTLGMARLLGPPFVGIHTPDPIAYWVGVVALMLVPFELIAVTLLSRHARKKVSLERPSISP